MTRRNDLGTPVLHDWVHARPSSRATADVRRASPPDALVRRLAVSGWLLTVGVTVAALATRLISGAPTLPNRFSLGDVAATGIGLLQVATATVAVVILVRIPRQRIGWLLMATGVFYSISILASAIAFATVADGPIGLAMAQWGGWFAFVTSTLSGVALTAIGFLFPSGRVGSTTLARLQWLLACPWIFWVVAWALQPGKMFLLTSLDNPLGFGPDVARHLTPTGVPTIAVAVGFLAVAIASVVWRFRQSRGVERQQMKWFAAAAVVMLVALGVTAAAGFASSDNAASEWPLVAYALAATAMPVAIGIAILRYRLYAIDRIISRTISYAVITAVLVGIFAAIVVGLQTILTQFTRGDTVPVAVSTLVVFALFQPLRRRVQATVDRHFDRARYDAERIQASFAARLRDNVDLASLAAEVRGVLGSTVAPQSVQLWLRKARSGDSQ